MLQHGFADIESQLKNNEKLSNVTLLTLLITNMIMILTAAYDIDGGRAGVDDWQDSKLLALRLYMQASEANNSLNKEGCAKLTDDSFSKSQPCTETKLGNKVIVNPLPVVSR